MRDPKPLLRSHPSGPAANLLRAARADVPPVGGPRRILARLGTAAGLAAATGLGEAAAAVGAGAGAVAKSVASVVVVIATAAGTGYVGHRAAKLVSQRMGSGEARAPTAATQAPAVLAASPSGPTALAASLSDPVVLAASPSGPAVPALSVAESSPAPVLTAAATDRAPDGDPVRPSTAPVAAPVVSRVMAPQEVAPLRGDGPLLPPPVRLAEGLAPSDLAVELAVFDGARRALRAAGPDEALRQLDAYEARFAPARFEQEATVLRVEALVALGATDRARGVGERFLATEPESTYAQRVRSLLGEPKQRAP